MQTSVHVFHKNFKVFNSGKTLIKTNRPKKAHSVLTGLIISTSVFRTEFTCDCCMNFLCQSLIFKSFEKFHFKQKTRNSVFYIMQKEDIKNAEDFEDISYTGTEVSHAVQVRLKNDCRLTLFERRPFFIYILIKTRGF